MRKTKIVLFINNVVQEYAYTPILHSFFGLLLGNKHSKSIIQYIATSDFA